MINIVEKGKNPHLALTHQMQSYSANNRPVSLLMKSNIKLTDELIKSIESLGLSNIEEIKKATWYRKKLDGLQKGLKESFCEDEEWCWIEDFNETEVLFWVGCELYKATYTEDADGMFTFSNEATPMVEVVSYEVADGELKISEAAEKALEEGTMKIVAKAFVDPEKSVQIAKSYFEKAAKTKKEGDVSLTAESYAYVPDDQKVSTWKLRIDDKSHTNAAVQALSPSGLMGNKVQIPEADLPAVKKKVKAAYKKFNPDASEQDLKDLFKAKDENNLVVKSELVSEGDKASDDNNTTINKSKENNEMSDNAVVDFTKSAEFIAMQKSLSDLQEQLQKANDEKLAIQKAKDESDKADMLAVLKGYSFVGDEAEALTEALFKNSAALVVLQTLEKAHKAIDAVATVEKGADAPEQVAKTASQSEQDDVMALIKAKKAAKK